MDMQSANREAPPDALQIAFQALVADPLGRLLRLPARERMGRCGDWRHAVSRRHGSNRTAQPPQIVSSLVEAHANPRADLDLRTQKLGTDLCPEQRLVFAQHAVGR